MVQFLSIIFFLGFLKFLLGFSKVPVFFVSSFIILLRHFHFRVNCYLKNTHAIVNIVILPTINVRENVLTFQKS